MDDDYIDKYDIIRTDYWHCYVVFRDTVRLTRERFTVCDVAVVHALCGTDMLITGHPVHVCQGLAVVFLFLLIL